MVSMDGPEPHSAPRFRLVVGPDTRASFVAEAVAKLPSRAAEQDSLEALFPRGPRNGICRICGTVAEMTEEHMPPKGALNVQRGRQVALDDALVSDELDPPVTGSWLQGGIRGYMLCEPCNNTTGRWGREYQEWARRAVLLLKGLPASVEELDESNGYSYVDVEFKNVYPARFVRQVIAMMLCVSGSAALGRRHPELVALALGGPAIPLPPPLRLYFNLYADSTARIIGGPYGQGVYSQEAGEWRWMLEVSFAPLATIMLLEGPSDPGLGMDISELTGYELDQRSNIEFRDLRVGFGHKPFPGDYRSRGRLIADQDLEG
jgi:hypothetical protein